MPPNTVRVARPGKWGNRHRVGDPGVPDAATAVRLFRESCETHPELMLEPLLELRGNDLACWCALDAPCHADVLLDLANR